MISELYTKYAPPERSTQAQVLHDHAIFTSAPYINEIFCSLSYIFCILNSNRQIVFGNDVMMKSLGITQFENVIGKRVGEALNCVFSGLEKGGCGTTEHCKYCGAVNSMLKCRVDQQKTTMECTIRRKVEETESTMELEVTATPMLFEGDCYTIFSIIDITDRKRRLMIERIFFHDLLNIAGGLSNIFEILDIVDEKEKTDLMQIAASLSKQVVNEISSQRMLVQAENDELAINCQCINSLEFAQTVSNDLRFHEVAEEKHIVVDKNSDSFDFTSDPVILRKVVNNMIKNALEASRKGDTVIVKTERLKDRIRFSVHNKACMSKEVELQVFMRSFSTKGMQRGLGTYSMKLLGEQYLGGDVGFETDESKGTTFFIDLKQ